MSEKEIYSNIISTLILLVGVWVLQYLANKAIDKQDSWASEERQRWKFHTRGIRLTLLCLGLATIWAAELKALAFSLVAFIAAIIIATKELILCVLGGILLFLDKSFSIGDRIEVGTFKGDVISQSLLTTKILEVGPGKLFNQYTGRELSIPNSIFLASSVLNETSPNKYALHSFQIAFAREIPWKGIEEQIISKANELIETYKSDASKVLDHYSKKRSLSAPSLEPKVFVSFHEHDSTLLTIRLPVPAKDRGKIEQQIIKSIKF